MARIDDDCIRVGATLNFKVNAEAFIHTEEGRRFVDKIDVKEVVEEGYVKRPVPQALQDAIIAYLSNDDYEDGWL